MATVTVRNKGLLTIPRALRDALGLVPGTKLQASIDQQGRLVLAPALFEPASLFDGRPDVERALSVEEMNEVVRTKAGREDA